MDRYEIALKKKLLKEETVVKKPVNSELRRSKIFWTKRANEFKRNGSLQMLVNLVKMGYDKSLILGELTERRVGMQLDEIRYLNNEPPRFTNQCPECMTTNVLLLTTEGCQGCQQRLSELLGNNFKYHSKEIRRMR